MIAIRLTCALLLVALPVIAEDFSLSMNGVGPINVHTTLVYGDKGELLLATATNDSGVPLAFVRMCVTATMKGYLFTLWNTQPWDPGASLKWIVQSSRRVPNLSHEVKIQALNKAINQLTHPMVGRDVMNNRANAGYRLG